MSDPWAGSGVQLLSPDEHVRGAPESHDSWAGSGIEIVSPEKHVSTQPSPRAAAPTKAEDEGPLQGTYHFLEALTGGPPPSNQGGITPESFWPYRMGKNIVSAIRGAAKAPRDVLEGKLDPSSPEGIGRALDFATIASGPIRFGRTAAGGSSGAANAFIRQQLPSYVDNAAITRAASLMDDATQRGVTLTWPEALSQVTGRPVLTDMQRVLEGAKQTRARMQEAIGDRPAEIRAAAEGEIAGIAPPTAQPSTVGPAIGEAAEGRIGEVRKTINQVSEPYYDAASTHTLTLNEMAQVRAIPGYEQAARAIRNDPQLNREVAHLPENSVGFLNEVKKQLDQAAENAASPVQQGRSVQRAAGLTRDAQAVRDAAINSEAAAGGGNYAQALNIQQTGRQRYLDPLLQGPLGKLADKDITTKKAIDALFPSDPLAGGQHEVVQAVHALSQRNPTAARQLVAAHIEAKLNEAFDAAGRTQEAAGFAGARFVHGLAGSPAVATQRGANFRAAVEALPNGRQIWPGVERFLEIARSTGTRQAIGSRTAFNEAELHGLGTGRQVGNVVSLAASPGEWMHAARDLWARWQTRQNLNELARIITDRRSEAIFRSLARQSPRSANALKTAAKLTILGRGDLLRGGRKDESL